MSEDVERESMEYDVVIVGAGPAGLAAAIRLKQLAEAAGTEISVAVLEKGSEVGAHILSGAVIDPIALNELIPDWKEKGAPLETPVTKDKWLLLGPQGELDIPIWLMPPFIQNHGCYIASLANVCRWLGQQAEASGVEVYPGMAVSDVIYNEDGSVKGVLAGVFGIGKDGEKKPDFQPGLELHAKYTFIAEGVRGSLANVCRWLGQQAEASGVEVYPGMAVSDVIYNEDGSVKGVLAGVFGIGKDGERKPDYQPGLELHAKYTFIAEGVRGSLAKQLQAHFNLCEDSDPQKFGIGLKEVWQVPDKCFRPGLAQHTTGWPLDNNTGGGSFMYHFGENYVAIGYVVHLNYKNPWLSPYDEFQRFKHHPSISCYLEGGKRIAYGARAITEGGYQSVPKLTFPGGVLIGCSAGFVNVPRIKGSHNAMKTGMMAAEAAFAAIQAGRAGDELVEYAQAYDRSWVKKELRLVRNAKPILSKFGTALGGFVSMLDMWCTYLLRGFSFFGTMHHEKTDSASTGLAKDYPQIVYPKPDGVLSFDKLSSVFLSATNHDEDQPSHLKLKDPSIPIDVNLPRYGEPARLYCPAGVYEVLYDEQGNNPRFQINAQNCVHCKTCDIKDPSQNIVWTTPEGGGGPNYPNM